MFAANLPTQTTSCWSANNSVGITEVVLAHDQGYGLLLPTLAYLSRNTRGRWFTWIAPQGINKQLLWDYGFNMQHVRLVHTLLPQQAFEVCRKALSIGNSHSVIASMGRLSGWQMKELENAAMAGGCSGLLLRNR